MLVEDNIHVWLKRLNGKIKERVVEVDSMVVMAVMKQNQDEQKRLKSTSMALLCKYFYSFCLAWAFLKIHGPWAEAMPYLDLYPLPGQVSDFTYSKGDFSFRRIRKLAPNKASRTNDLSTLAAFSLLWAVRDSGTPASRGHHVTGGGMASKPPPSSDPLTLI